MQDSFVLLWIQGLSGDSWIPRGASAQGNHGLPAVLHWASGHPGLKVTIEIDAMKYIIDHNGRQYSIV